MASNTYKALTEDAIRDFMISLGDYKEPRQMVVQTGIGGMEMFNIEMENSIYLPICQDLLYKEHKITKEQYDNLVSMIKSSDRENFQVAKQIINNIQHGSII